MSRPARMLVVARAQRRALIVLLAALLAALASSTGAHAATLPLSIAAPQGQGEGTPAEVGQLHGVAATAAGQPAAVGALATETVRQAASAAPSGGTPLAPQASTQALTAGAGRSVQGVVAEAGAPSRGRGAAQLAEGVADGAAGALAHAPALGSGALGHATPLLAEATDNAGAIVRAPVRSVAGVLAAGSAAAARMLGPAAQGARQLPVLHARETRPLGAFGRGPGGGPPSLGPGTIFFGAAAALFTPLAQEPQGSGPAGIALGCLPGTSETWPGRCETVWAALLAPGTNAAPASAGILVASRAPPLAAPSGPYAQLVSHSGASPGGSPPDSIVGGPGAVAAAASASGAVALMLAVLLLLGPPAIRRTLLLDFSPSPAFAFALLPERPG